ncbi:MAG: cobyrinate a,c-diamide synthase [Prochloron sp. SP5CPC1]|nr:cobyrinate a,c-diamide synthase [Candidatus Paraprochloron terpiosi SP5CPC1]
MSLVIAGERSGVGKTTVTLALLAYLSRENRVQSFKVGPDYIDPMFHQAVTDRPCRNLDPVLTSEAYVQSCFTRHCQGVDYALIEGVMGLFDGVISPNNHQEQIKDFASTAHIARLLDVPVLLVLDCSKLSGSVAAIAHGYSSFDPSVKIAGLVLNRVGSDRHLELLQNALQPTILGILRRQDNITIPDRHLGLVPTAELEQFDALIDRLAELGKTCFNWKRLLPLLEIEPRKKISYQLPPKKCKIALAWDRAFNFYYQDNLDILEELGAELIPWSPLRDSHLPRVGGLYIGGGFPEVFAQELAANQQAKDAVRYAIKGGTPTYAECGGLMYLCQQLVDFSYKSWSMVGVLPATVIMGKKLTLGYRQATALENSPFLDAGETVWGHEFHRSQLNTTQPPLFVTKILQPQSPVSIEGMTMHRVHASYIHLHFGEDKRIAHGLVKMACSAQYSS